MHRRTPSHGRFGPLVIFNARAPGSDRSNIPVVPPNSGWIWHPSVQVPPYTLAVSVAGPFQAPAH
jgi:hypothetical protein